MYKKEYGKQLEDVKEWHRVDPDLFTKDRQQMHDNLRYVVQFLNLDTLSPPKLSTQLGLSKKELAPTADMDEADRLQVIAEARERRNRATDSSADATGTGS